MMIRIMMVIRMMILRNRAMIIIMTLVISVIITFILLVKHKPDIFDLRRSLFLLLFTFVSLHGKWPT